MAVTIVSSPPTAPTLWSCSMPGIVKLTSDKYGTANVTQFRYLVIATGLAAVATKYTVPDGSSGSDAYVSIDDLFRTKFQLSPNQYGSTTPIPKSIFPTQQGNANLVTLSIQVKEQYYLSGVFTTNTGATRNFDVMRGYSRLSNGTWEIPNWFDDPRYSAISDLFTYSGKAKYMLPVESENPSWTPDFIHPYVIYKYMKNGTGTVIASHSVTRGATGKQKVVYIPLLVAGHTDQDDFKSLQIEVYTNTATTWVSGTLVNSYSIEKTIDPCVDDENVLMFQDRYFQWSFLSFTKYRSTTINTQPQRAESLDGRFRYNVKSRDLITLNSDWVDDDTNEMFRDLLVSEQVYLMDPDGDIEPVTIAQNSLRLQTSDVEGLHQYTFQVEKSIDNFKP